MKHGVPISMKRVLLILLIAGAAFLAWLVFFPGPALHLAAGVLEGRAAMTIDPGRVSGNLVSGLTLVRPRVVIPAARVSAERFSIDFDWSALLDRTLAVSRIELDAPVVVMTPGPKNEEEEEPEDVQAGGKEPVGWAIAAPRVVVKDGVVLLAPEAKGPFQRIERIHVNAGYSAGEVVVRRASAIVAESTVTVRGRGEAARRYVSLHLRSEGPLEAQLDVRGSRSNFSAAGGGRWKNAYARVKARGRWPDIVWNLEAHAAPLDVAGLRAKRARVAASGSGFAPIRASAEARAEGVQWGATEVRSLSASVSGSTASHAVALEVRTPDQGLSLRGRGRLDGKTWTADWSSGRVDYAGGWRANQPFSTVIGPGLVRVNDLSLASGSSRVAVDGTLRGKTISSGRFDVRDFELSTLSDAGLVAEPLAGRVNAKGRVSGSLRDPSVSVNGSAYGLRFREIAVASATLGGRYESGVIWIDALHLRPRTGTAFVSGRIPVKAPRGDRDISLTLRASGLDPAPFLVAWKPEAKNARLDADLRIAIRGKQFSATGPLQLTADRLALRGNGVDLRDLVIEARGDGDVLRIRRGAARAGKKGRISLSGSVSADSLDVRLTAHRFSFDDPRGISGELNGELALAGSMRSPRIEGDVAILEAVIEPSRGRGEKKKEGKDKEAEKAVEPRRPPPPNALAMDVKVRWDRDVWYRDGQTAVETKGELDVTKRPWQRPRMFGAIEVIRGNYFLYGRRFEVEEGIVRFAGDPLSDSVITVHALYTEPVSKTKIWVDVTGSLAKPLLALRSDPQMDEGNIISVLVTGRPMDDLGRADDGDEPDSEAMATKVIANYFADRLRQGVQGRFDVDVLEFDYGDTGNPEITVGENVSKRLYVAYGQTLAAEGQRKLEAEYTLTPHWSLDGTTSTDGRYVIDLLFRFGFR